MERAADQSRVLRFGVFEVDLEAGELRKSGMRQKLARQPFQVLQVLLERSQEIVTREELRHHIWPNDTFVDYDLALKKAVSRVREVLGDSPDSPRFIETIPRRGYRFIGTVNGNGAVAPSAGAVTSEKALHVADSKQFRRRLTVALGLVLFLLIGYAARFIYRSRLSGGRTEITRVTHWHKAINSAILSPDGHAVAFTSPASGYDQVFVVLAAGGEPHQLTSDEGSKYVDSFSLEGTEIYYRRSLGVDEEWAVPTLGGTGRRLVSGFALVPSADGKSSFYFKRDNLALVRSPRSGLGEEVVSSFKDFGVWPFRILPFPGGDRLLVVARNYDVGYGATACRVYDLNIRTGRVSTLSDIAGANTDFSWRMPGKNLVFSRSVKGVTNLWQYSLADHNLTQLSFGAGPDVWPLPDRAGIGIYFVNGTGAGALSVYWTDRKGSMDIEMQNATQPAISHDGRRLMYVVLPEPGRSELWVSDIDGGNKARIASTESGNLGTLDWSFDDTHLAFADFGSSGYRLFTSLSDGSERRQIPFSGLYFGDIKWDPNGNFLYVSGYEKDVSKLSTWKLSADGARTEVLEKGCGIARDISPDGTHLLFTARYGVKAGIYEMSVTDKRCNLLVPDVGTFVVRFARDGQSVLYTVSFPSYVAIHKLPWKNGRVAGPDRIAYQVPFGFAQDYQGNAYDLSRDLSAVVFAHPSGQADLYVLTDK
ncbi:MAG: winged helix-turn-helix domain-containing protein [Candidatus Acidiferrales bacterium]